MTTARMMFTVPEDTARLGEILADNGVQEGVGGFTDADEIHEFLATRIGSDIEVEFDEEQPIDAILDLADALDLRGARYWGVFDAFEERSRGIRVLGRTVLNLTGQRGARSEMPLPWESGRPALDEVTLVAGGMARAEAEAVVSVFLAPTVAPPGP